MLPVYKGKGDKRECSNHRGISVLSVVGKMYGRILIERVRALTDNLIGEEQGGFRKGRGCLDQVFVVKSLCEKFREKGREVYMAFMDLEKAYDRIDREALWKVVHKYGIRGKLLDAMKGLYIDSRACVKVEGMLGRKFGVSVGLDSIVREVKRECREDGLGLESTNGEGLFRVSMVLYADDTVLLGESRESLQRLVSVF